MDKKKLGLVLGIAVAAATAIIPIDGLTYEGRMTLGLTLMTVVFWAFQVAQSGYTSGLYLGLLIVTGCAPSGTVFASWTGPTMYLVIGAYLIAGAVKSSGLGERIAYAFIIKFVDSYNSIIISAFVLTFILSILIPHPWPRAFLIMSVMSVVIRSANLPREDAVKIGFSVFAASVPVSLIFLTGDSVINPLAVQASGVQVGWSDWFKYMGVPAIAASIITCLMILVLFKPSKKVTMNKDEIRAKLSAMGKLKVIEKRTMVWLVIAVAFWMTDSVHGVNIGWVTLIIAMLMSLPVVGEVLTPKSWSEVPVHVLLFLTAAMAIGKVGGATGMNSWIANTILPSSVPANPFILAALIAAISIGIHMVLGSVIAVMGVAIPALLAFTLPMGINPLIPTFLVYTAIAVHYVFPFQHLNMLVGQGDENGMYSQKETMRLGIPLTAAVFIITVAVEVPWWMLLGLF
ncbi:SLC13 family permease [Youngiibacter multivorans]|uniref:Di/tricarboxylate transporter n=1 Tax=Youngiibacter multivorans TaxID=937251 RepID=A0ABS4G1J0_9CLOT|nr:SLC13 family permease [Youngiibacter multivorans]MBP1918417.1 di/tricarboxylate transporter [Youngiibacter multivorans]